MIAALYTDLRRRGVELRLSPNCRDIEFTAPAGVMDEFAQAALKVHKTGMIEYLYELEEAAAILEIEQGNGARMSEVLARQCVPDGYVADDDGLLAYAQAHSTVRALDKAFRRAGYGGLEILSVERSSDEAQRAA